MTRMTRSGRLLNSSAVPLLLNALLSDQPPALFPSFHARALVLPRRQDCCKLGRPSLAGARTAADRTPGELWAQCAGATACFAPIAQSRLDNSPLQPSTRSAWPWTAAGAQCTRHSAVRGTLPAAARAPAPAHPRPPAWGTRKGPPLLRLISAATRPSFPLQARALAP